MGLGKPVVFAGATSSMSVNFARRDWDYDFDFEERTAEVEDR
jgi:hypothetical protein